MIPIYHAGEQDGLLYVTMRYVDGTDLARLIAVEARLDPIRAAVIIGQVGGGARRRPAGPGSSTATSSPRTC